MQRQSVNTAKKYFTHVGVVNLFQDQLISDLDFCRILPFSATAFTSYVFVKHSAMWLSQISCCVVDNARMRAFIGSTLWKNPGVDKMLQTL